MFIDAANAPDTLTADLVVVGSGAAGLAAASEFLESRHSVIVLESGGPKRERSVEALNIGSSADPAIHAPPHLFRARTVGGATSIWGGRCVPLDPIDFETRDWVPHSGWPISYSDVARWHARAMTFLEAGAPAFDETTLATLEPWIEGMGDDGLPTSIERFSPPTHVGRRRRQALLLSRSVTIVTHATCLAVVASGNGRFVDHLRCRAPDGRSLTVRARYVVLAAGGLENARILLASQDRDARGLGNGHDCVGRYYMCHLEGTFGEFVLMPADRRVRWGFERTADGVYARRRLVLPAADQRRHHLLNGVARLHYPLAADPIHRDPVLSLMYLVKALLIPEFHRKVAMIDRSRQARLSRRKQIMTAHVRNVLLGTPRLAGFVTDWVRRRHLAYRRIPYVALPSATGRYPLDFNGEQEPNPLSRVSLARDTDPFGIPRLSIDWRKTDADCASVLATFDFWRVCAERVGVGTVAYDRDALIDEIKDCVPVGGHHIGTTRMSDSPRTGVVDAQCRVHGIENLHIVGASVFPTCGHANPTVTIVSLALRLASHLKIRMDEEAMMVTS